jgi:hypothetical protein
MASESNAYEQELSDLSSIAMKYLANQYNWIDAAQRVILTLVEDMRDGNHYASQLAHRVSQMNTDLYVPDWRRVMYGQCIGVTQKGWRCGRLRPDDCDRDNIWVCRNHADQIGEVHLYMADFFESATKVAQRRERWLEAMTDESSDEFVYFISDGEFLKIGKSVSPQTRLAVIKTDAKSKKPSILIPDGVNGDELQILLTIPGGTRRERQMHMLCREWNVIGEWFIYGESLRARLRSLGIDLDARQLIPHHLGLEVV